MKTGAAMTKTALLVLTGLLTATAVLTAQENSSRSSRVYVPIPGVSQKMNTEDTIQKLLFVKKLPIQSKEKDIEDIKIETSVVKDLNTYLRELDGKSRSLYDYQSPFREMNGISSDTDIIEASAGRKAKKENYRMQVLVMAKPDSFMSSSTPRNKVLPASDFTITVAGESYKIRFAGGTLAQLAKVIEEQTKAKIEVRMINDTPATSILVISTLETGEKNRITISGNAQALLDCGLMKMGQDRTSVVKVPLAGLPSGRQNQPNPQNETITMGPNYQAEAKPVPFKIEKNTLFQFSSSFLKYPAESLTPASGLTNPPVIAPMEGVTVSNITVEGGSLISFYEDQVEKPAIVSNFTEILTLVFTDGSVKTYFIDNDGQYSNSLETYAGKTVDRVILKNANTDRDVVITGPQFVTRSEEGGLQPGNRVSKACDAILSIDGVEVRRDKNIIEDLVEGVTFTAKNESDRTVTVTIDHNYQKSEEALQAWVDSYNKVMEYLSIVTKPNQDRTRLSEKSPQQVKTGIFQTETSYLTLRSRLRTSAQNSYKTDFGRELALLEQIGIFTKKSGTFSMQSDEWTQAKMGLLTVDPEKLKQSLKTRFDGVEQIFAYDSEGDLVKDTGVAVAVNNTLKLALGAGSFPERRIAYNDNKIKEVQKDIEEMNSDLSDYELQLRMKFGKMNQAINEGDSKQKWLNSQFK